MNHLSLKSLMLRSCYLYYIDGMDIQDISKLLGISRFKVSRYISKAREDGLISLHINDPDIDFEAQAIQVEQAFKLHRVIVVPVTANANRDEQRQAIGRGGAVIFENLDRDCNLAITWGRTMAYLIKEMAPGASTIKNVVELAGSVGKITKEVSAHAVSTTAAEKLNAACIQLPAPIIVESSATAEILMKEPSIQQTLSMASECDLAISGVGPVRDTDSSLHRAGYLSEQDLLSLEQSGAVGSILGRFFDKEGNECDTPFKDRVIALDLTEYKKIPERILCAGGMHKVDAIFALARNGVITSLVTDSETAMILLEKIQ